VDLGLSQPHPSNTPPRITPSRNRRYFSSPAHWVDAISNALLVVCCALWWAFVVRHARAWSMQLTYNVYSDLQPVANFLHLAAGGQGLSAAWRSIRGLEAAVNVVSWYYALSGINILLLLARCVDDAVASTGWMDGMGMVAVRGVFQHIHDALHS